MRSNAPGRLRKRAFALLRHTVAIAAGIAFLLPIIWAITSSLRETGRPTVRTLDWIPDPIAWRNYREVFELVPLHRYALNSLLVAAVAVALTILTASWAGFALAQISQRWRL